MSAPRAHATLTRGQLSTLRRALLAEEQRLRETTATSSVVADAVPREADPSDEATESVAQDEALAGGRRARQHLVEVEAALTRIAAGTYGTSEVSGEPIGYPRLSAVPWATLTAAEQDDYERLGRR